MDFGEAGLFAGGEGFLPFGFAFPGEAGDQIGRDGGLWPYFPDFLDCLQVGGAVIAATHSLKRCVRARLKRDVEMADDLGVGEKQV